MSSKKDKRKYIILGAGDDPLAHHDDWIRETVSDLIGRHHEHLQQTNIEIAWLLRKRPDQDGNVILGKMRRTTELERNLHGWDAVLMLNAEHWEILNEHQRRALLDHELCHLDYSYDKDGIPKEDGHGRLQYRIRKHDIEEFVAVVDRHGIYMDDIKEFVEATRKTPLYKNQVKPRRRSVTMRGEGGAEVEMTLVKGAG